MKFIGYGAPGLGYREYPGIYFEWVVQGRVLEKVPDRGSTGEHDRRRDRGKQRSLSACSVFNSDQ